MSTDTIITGTMKVLQRIDPNKIERPYRPAFFDFVRLGLKHNLSPDQIADLWDDVYSNHLLDRRHWPAILVGIGVTLGVLGVAAGAYLVYAS